MGPVLAVSTSQVSNIQMFLKCYGRNDAIKRAFVFTAVFSQLFNLPEGMIGPGGNGS